MVRGCWSVLLQRLSRLHGKAFARLHPPCALITRYPADVRRFGRAGRHGERQRPVSITTARTLWRTGTFMLEHGCIPVCRLTRNPCTCILTSNLAEFNTPGRRRQRYDACRDRAGGRHCGWRCYFHEQQGLRAWPAPGSREAGLRPDDFVR